MDIHAKLAQRAGKVTNGHEKFNPVCTAISLVYVY